MQDYHPEDRKNKRLPCKLLIPIWGVPVTVCDAASAVGGSWSSADQIVFGTAGGGLSIVPASEPIDVSSMTTGTLSETPNTW